jgi:electron transfer flavoprotein alpha subunit
MSLIWIIAENEAWAADLLAGAKNIDAGARLVAFVKGDESAARSAVSFGAAQAYALPLPQDTLWEAYVPVLAEKAAAEKPALILVSASRRGRDMAAQLSARLDAPCFSDARNLSLNGSIVNADTMVYGGMAVRNASAMAETVLATIGAKNYEPVLADASLSGEVGVLTPAPSQAKVAERKPRAARTVNLAEAAKVVGVGRGFTDQADLEHARELARAMGAALACSRPIAEFFKWMPEECYIGISGQVIKPQIYMAVGISGQAQHYFGVKDAKVIVSVNKDPECLMNLHSDYYIVGDWKEVIPNLIRALQ